MASDGAVLATPSWMDPSWLTADTTGQQASGHVAVSQDNDATIPNPQVPLHDDVIDYDVTGLDAGQPGEGWVPESSFPWPALPPNGDGIVAVVPGMTGNGNDNDDPSGMPGYDGPRLKYSGAYTGQLEQGGNDALAQSTNTLGFNNLQPGANMGYQRTETRLMRNLAAGYVNIWRQIWNVTPPVKTANQFTAQPFEGGELPDYANLGLSNSGGTAYYVQGPAAPDVSDAQPSANSWSPDPAAGWA